MIVYYVFKQNAQRNIKEQRTRNKPSKPSKPNKPSQPMNGHDLIESGYDCV